jgi:hypothetical protein
VKEGDSETQSEASVGPGSPPAENGDRAKSKGRKSAGEATAAATPAGTSSQVEGQELVWRLGRVGHLRTRGRDLSIRTMFRVELQPSLPEAAKRAMKNATKCARREQARREEDQRNCKCALDGCNRDAWSMDLSENRQLLLLAGVCGHSPLC